MKKRLAAILLACVVALAIPCVAFAIPSGAVNGDTTTSVGTDKLGKKADLQMTVEGADWVKIEETGSIAKNVPEDMIKGITDGTVVAAKSYEITASNENAHVTLVYTTDKEFAGLTCHVYVEHADGTTEEFVKPVAADGTVTVEMDKLSTVSFFITNEKYVENDKAAGGAKAKAAATDSKSTSPKTGVVA